MRLYCRIGDHGGPEVPARRGPPAPLPGGWRRVPVALDPKTNRWYYDPESPVCISVCPACKVWGEPEPATEGQ